MVLGRIKVGLAVAHEPTIRIQVERVVAVNADDSSDGLNFKSWIGNLSGNLSWNFNWIFSSSGANFSRWPDLDRLHSGVSGLIWVIDNLDVADRSVDIE